MTKHTIRTIEETIRKAFEVDKLLPPAFPNRTKGSALGAMVVIPDSERKIEDLIAECMKRGVTNEDLEIWNKVMFDWLPVVNLTNRAVIKYRCQGRGWKSVAYCLKAHKIFDRELTRPTLIRYFNDGLRQIMDKY